MTFSRVHRQNGRFFQHNNDTMYVLDKFANNVLEQLSEKLYLTLLPINRANMTCLCYLHNIQCAMLAPLFRCSCHVSLYSSCGSSRWICISVYRVSQNEWNNIKRGINQFDEPRKGFLRISENFDIDSFLLSLAVKRTYWCNVHFTAGLRKDRSTTLAGVRDTIWSSKCVFAVSNP